MHPIKRPLVFLIAFLIAVPALAQSRRGDHWVATWATALVARPAPAGPRGQGPAPAAPAAPAAAAPAAAPAPAAPAASGAAPAAPAPAAPAPGGGRGGFAPPTTLTNQTIRQIVRTSIGGNRVRVVLSNAFGTAPIDVGAGHVALRDKEAAIVASSAKPLTVSGASTFTVLGAQPSSAIPSILRWLRCRISSSISTCQVTSA